MHGGSSLGSKRVGLRRRHSLSSQLSCSFGACEAPRDVCCCMYLQWGSLVLDIQLSCSGPHRGLIQYNRQREADAPSHVGRCRS